MTDAKPPASSIPAQIAAYQRMTVPELLVEYERLHGRPPHVRTSRAWLWKRCAYRIQEIAYGGLPDDARTRLEQLMAEVVVPAARAPLAPVAAPVRKKDALPSGMTLTREWHGQQVVVRVTPTGFEWNGTPFRSLSAVAQAVTGQHWSGNLFFGLKKRSKAG